MSKVLVQKQANGRQSGQKPKYKKTEIKQRQILCSMHNINDLVMLLEKTY